MGAEELLAKLAATTHLPQVQLKIDSSDPSDSKTMRLLSRYEQTGDKIELDLMGRLLSGNPHPSRFLIEQRIDLAAPSYKINMWAVVPPDPNKVIPFPFVPWDDMPSTELKNFDLVLPFPFDATLLDPAPAPQPGSPGDPPPATCKVVELALKTPTHDVGSDRMRLWIEDLGPAAVDHRVEHYRGATLLRVVFGPPTQRTTVNVQNGRKTVTTVTASNANHPIPHDQFMWVNLTSNTW